MMNDEDIYTQTIVTVACHSLSSTLLLLFSFLDSVFESREHEEEWWTWSDRHWHPLPTCSLIPPSHSASCTLSIMVYIVSYLKYIVLKQKKSIGTAHKTGKKTPRFTFLTCQYSCVLPAITLFIDVPPSNLYSLTEMEHTINIFLTMYHFNAKYSAQMALFQSLQNKLLLEKNIALQNTMLFSEINECCDSVTKTYFLRILNSKRQLTKQTAIIYSSP